MGATAPVAVRSEARCRECRVCEALVCRHDPCVGCGACVIACPHEAVRLAEEPRAAEVDIFVESKRHRVPSSITVREALARAGFETSAQPAHGALFVPCGVGGCWSCAVRVDGVVVPACVSEATVGCRIELDVAPGEAARRIVDGYQGHAVGGVGTPWELKGGAGSIEAACFTAGCNLRCPQCQNWTTACRGKGRPSTPAEVARRLTRLRAIEQVDRIAVSGGESTLNRAFLVRLLTELQRLNPDPDARLHVDTNGTLLSRDYVDELVAAGSP